jgi:uroporphyrinogen III methyltransferase/synthase
VRSPSAIVVGAVGALDLAWFETRPLFGRTVAITRAREQASGLKRDLEALGATVVEMPTIAIEPMAFTVPDLAAYAWVAFTSPNGVEALFTELNAAGRDARAFGPARVAAIGPGTATALAAHGVIADLVPDRFVAESLVDAWPAPETEPERVLIVRPQDARDVLDAGLTTRGYTVDALVVYRTAPEAIAAEAKERLVAGAIDAVTLTSSSTATNLVAALGEVPEVLRADAAAATAVISIGPVTTQTAVELGLRVDVEADPHTIAGLLQALVDRLGPSTPR